MVGPTHLKFLANKTSTLTLTVTSLIDCMCPVVQKTFSVKTHALVPKNFTKILFAVQSLVYSIQTKMNPNRDLSVLLLDKCRRCMLTASSKSIKMPCGYNKMRMCRTSQ